MAHIAVDIHTFVCVYTVKLSLSMTWRREWSGGRAPLILTWELDQDEWLTSRTGHFILGENPGIHFVGGLWGPRTSLEGLGEQEISCTARNSYPRPSRA